MRERERERDIENNTKKIDPTEITNWGNRVSDTDAIWRGGARRRKMGVAWSRKSNSKF